MKPSRVEHPRLSLIVSATPSAHDRSLHAPLSLHKQLLQWFDQKPERSVPWRRAGLSEQERAVMSKKELSLYAYQIWVSEIMCQQTRLETAVPFYERWMQRFGTLEALAEASVEDVREMWTGLGYYNRATRLLAGAQKVVQDYGGKMPQDPAVLQKEIPGIGPYTSAAITSIAFNTPIAAVDGNVQRVYSRVFGIYANPSAKATSSHLQDLADQIMPEDRPGDYNQALMDLGFSVCTPKNPSCASCPLAAQCVAYAQERLAQGAKPDIGDIEAAGSGKCTLCAPLPTTTADVTRYPMPKERKKSKEDDCAVCVLEWRDSKVNRDGKYLLLKRPEEGLLAGMWELPSRDLESGSTLEERLAALKTCLKRALKTPIDLTDHRELDTVVHKFSHITRSYIPHHVRIESEQLPEPKLPASQALWVDADTLLKSNIPGAIKTIFTDFHSDGSKSATSKKKVPRKRKNVSELASDQKSLSHFFTKPSASSTAKKEPSTLKASAEAPNSDPPKPRKVRVIADSEDDSA